VLRALSTLEKKGKLTINVNAHIVCAPVNFAMETQENLVDLLERAADYDSEHVNAKRVKFWLDGAPLPPQYLPPSMNISNPVTHTPHYYKTARSISAKS